MSIDAAPTKLGFDDGLALYRDESTPYATQCQIAIRVASTEPGLLETCAKRIHQYYDPHDRLAISHFASAYFKQGNSHKQHLISLLQTQDATTAAGLLHVLSIATDLDENGAHLLGTRLGETELPHHIAHVASIHWQLTPNVAETLGRYGYSAHAEASTILRAMLWTGDSTVWFRAKVALWQVDRDGLYRQFRLDPLDEPLSADQRTAIESYLAECEERRLAAHPPRLPAPKPTP